MTNLWKETIRALEEHGKTFENVEYIQGTDFGITKENFEKVAKKSNYNSGFGSPKVAEDLVVVGDNWWIERQDYDGSEWWEYKEKPKQISKIKEVRNIADGMWMNQQNMALTIQTSLKLRRQMMIKKYIKTTPVEAKRWLQKVMEDVEDV